MALRKSSEVPYCVLLKSVAELSSSSALRFARRYPKVALRTAVLAKSSLVLRLVHRRGPVMVAYVLPTKSRLRGRYDGWLLVENLTRRTTLCIVVYV